VEQEFESEKEEKKKNIARYKEKLIEARTKADIQTEYEK